MALVVQKYGGTSVGSVERIQAVARRIHQTVHANNQVVVVVSAMGKTTDGLVKLAQEISSNPSHREMDMLLSTGEQVSIALLSMALHELGQPARSLTGAQVGIVTEAHHTRARILEIKTDRIRKALDQHEVVVVAGFQGITNTTTFEITTLGRGGSDTSAVALAAVLQADRCEIYTDVPGILTTDPRLVPDAQLMTEVTCDEMLELASLGAKVLHPRAVEIARNYGVMLVVRSSWTDEPGTCVLAPPVLGRSLQDLEIGHLVDRIEVDTDQAKVALLRVPDRPGIAAKLFREVADRRVNVDLIIQSIHESNTNDIAFTVGQTSLSRATAVAEAVLPHLNPQSSLQSGAQPEVMTDGAIAKVSIEGAGMIGRPGVAAKMFRALAAASVNIQMISTSEVKLSCVIAAVDRDRALTALCEAFEVTVSPVQPARVSHLKTAQYEQPPVRGVALDRQQAQLAIRSIPDEPGMAAQIFSLLAEHQISVDMIIQSQRCRWVEGRFTRDLACTIAQADADLALQVLTAAAADYGWQAVEINPAIAKVSVVGSGMMTQPGVAAKVFEALAAAQINILMIATSEIKISCLVTEEQGVTALQAIHAAFELQGSTAIQVPA
ncbi:MAG: aspartate kinase [Cyanobacteria bacterium P01_H01_bin.121]